MAEAHFIKKADGSFSPAYPEDQEAFKRIAIGDPIRVKWSKPRNYMNHKRFFAMLKCTVQNLPESIPDRYQNQEFLRMEVLIGIGHIEIRESLGGKIFAVPKSMSFDKMGEDEFNEIYSLASNYILKHFLPGLDEQTFNENLKLFM
jgi:hypothetical protein